MTDHEAVPENQNLVGILIRWDAVIAGIKHGFSFYSSK